MFYSAHEETHEELARVVEMVGDIAHQLECHGVLNETLEEAHAKDLCKWSKRLKDAIKPAGVD